MKILRNFIIAVMVVSLVISMPSIITINDNTVTADVIQTKSKHILEKSSSKSKLAGKEMGDDTFSPIISSVENDDGKLVVKFTKVDDADSYQIYRAHSRFGEYELIDTIEQQDGEYVEYVDDNPNKESIYSNYYKVKANSATACDYSLPGSLEITKFGFNTYIFDERDDTEQVDDIIYNIYQKQRYEQFGSDRYQLFFKPDMDDSTISDYNGIKKIGDFLYLNY